MKQLLILLPLVCPTFAFAADCDPNGLQPQLECFDGDFSNGEITEVGVTETGNGTFLDANANANPCIDIWTGQIKPCSFYDQVETQIHYDWCNVTVMQLLDALLRR